MQHVKKSKDWLTRIKTLLLFAMCCLSILLMFTASSSHAADVPPPPGIPAAPSTNDIDVRPVDNPARPAAWDKAVDEANKPHLDEVLSPRPMAAIIGAVWFLLALRAHRKRRRQRAA